jgi:osmoprotectant transport system permease protein
VVVAAVAAGLGAAWLATWSGLLGARLREQVPELLESLPTYFGGHVRLSLLALAVGVSVSLPLGVWISTRPRWAGSVLAFAGILQTIPSLALLALMVPLLGGTIGFWPAFAAMILYSLLPILKNTVTGIRDVDPSLVESARGLGMSDREVRNKVQLPLARRSILGGIRIATVLVVGSATLATPVGDRTLGNYIFIGLNTRDYVQVTFGCVMAAVLAVVLDQLIGLIEDALEMRDRGARRLYLCVGGACLLLLVAGGLYRPVARLARPPARVVTIGTHDYTEQYVLGEVMSDALRSSGHFDEVDWRKGMAQQFTLDAVCNGEIDVCIDYTGNVWTNLMKMPLPDTPERTYEGVKAYLHENHGVECLGRLGFENAYAVAVRKEDADRLGIRTLTDLGRHAPGMRIGGDLMFFENNEWKHVRKVYGLRFADAPVELDPTLMYEAIKQGAVDVIVAYTTDARLEAYGLVIVEDDRKAFPSYDAILLISARAASRYRSQLIQVLQPLLVEKIDQPTMIQANRRIDVERAWPRKAGKELTRRLRARGAGS